MKRLFQIIFFCFPALHLYAQPIQGICKSSFGFKNTDNARVNILANSPGSLHQLYSTNGFTWEAWFKSNTSAINESSVISTEDSIYCQDILLGFGWGGTPNALSFLVRENGPDCNTATVESLQPVIPNTWYHLAAVCDYDNAVLKLYLNGNLLAAGVIPANVLNNRLSNDRLTQIGNQSSYFPNGIDGDIDEVRFWNTVRTQTEIQQTMNQCLVLPQNGLVACFKADENMLLTANSTVNANFSGLLDNATWSTQVPFITCSTLAITDSLTSCSNYNFNGLISNVDPGAIASWQWYFGDGGTANTQNTSHAYSAAGNYTVKLIVTDITGCKDSTIKNIAGFIQITDPLSDTIICAGNYVTLSVSLPQSPGTVILPPGSQFEYTFNTPPGNWTTTTGGWIQGNAPFGNEANGSPPEFNYNTYWPAGIDGSSYLYARRNIDLTNYDLSTIHWYLGVDNGFALYINGIRVDSEYAEGYTYRWEYDGIIPAALLHPGNNVIAIALVDNGGLTAFDMMIEGQPVNPGVSILWSTGDTTASIHVTPAQTTTYYVMVTYGSISCTDNVKVMVNHPSSLTINTSICQGSSYSGYTASGTYLDTLMNINGCDSILTLNLTVIPRSSFTIDKTICQGDSYSGYTSGGIYIDTLIAANGCDSIRTLRVTVSPKPHPYLGADTILCSGDSLILYPGQFTTYTWQNGSSQSHRVVKQPGLYSVVVTDNCGSARDEIMITEVNCDIYFPSAFTPNNDGKNDWFKILGGYNLKEYHLVVYNRWGQKVFETFDYTKGWDGNLNGQLQPSAAFVWYCEFKKPGNMGIIKMKGTVTLIK